MTLLFGVDFTSAPSPKKQIVAAIGQLDDETLSLQSLERYPDWAGFESLLQRPGPWVGGFDLPISLPHRVLDTLDWPRESWAAMAQFLSTLPKADYETALRNYAHAQPVGQKHPLRETDRVTRSSSPIKLVYPPVGKMLYTGVPRLWRAGVMVLPCGVPSPSIFTSPFIGEVGEASVDASWVRVALEAYPALIARRLAKALRPIYKTDTLSLNSPERLAGRQAMLSALAETVQTDYGLILDFPPWLQTECLDDTSGDSLDAVFCLIQAAWALSMQNDADRPWGIPLRAWKGAWGWSEGWIADPILY